MEAVDIVKGIQNIAKMMCFDIFYNLSYVTSECDCQLAMMTIGLRVDEGEVDPDWLMEAVPKRITRKQGRNLPERDIDAKMRSYPETDQ